MKRIRRVALAGACAMVALFGTPFANPAAAGHVRCGDTITQNTVLDFALGPCPFDGLIIGADNITLDFSGFTVSGLNRASQGVGVRLAGHTGVTIKNGSVRQFQTGISIEDAPANVVSNMTVIDNKNGGGIDVSGPLSDNNQILDNVVVGNGPFDGIGAYGGTSADKLTGTIISGNDVRDNATSGMTGGIRLENWTWNTTVSDNSVLRSPLEGIATFADTQFTTISGNTVRDNGFGTATDKPPRSGDGIRAFARSANHTISGNTVTGNAGNGIFLSGPVTLSTGVVAGVASTSVTGNTATGNNALPDKIIVDLAGFHYEGRVESGVTVAGQSQYVSLPATQVAYDLHDGNANCGTNTWSANTYGTRNPASCVS